MNHVLNGICSILFKGDITANILLLHYVVYPDFNMKHTRMCYFHVFNKIYDVLYLVILDLKLLKCI